MLGHGVYNVKSNIQAGAIIEIAVRDALECSLAAFFYPAVYQRVKEFEACHLELAVDFIFQESDLSPNEFFCQVQLLLQFLKLCSQFTFFCLQVLDAFLLVLPSFKPCG